MGLYRYIVKRRTLIPAADTGTFLQSRFVGVVFDTFGLEHLAGIEIIGHRQYETGRIAHFGCIAVAVGACGKIKAGIQQVVGVERHCPAAVVERLFQTGVEERQRLQFHVAEPCLALVHIACRQIEVERQVEAGVDIDDDKVGMF